MSIFNPVLVLSSKWYCDVLLCCIIGLFYSILLEHLTLIVWGDGPRWSHILSDAKQKLVKKCLCSRHDNPSLTKNIPVSYCLSHYNTVSIIKIECGGYNWDMRQNAPPPNMIRVNELQQRQINKHSYKLCRIYVK